MWRADASILAIPGIVVGVRTAKTPRSTSRVGNFFMRVLAESAKRRDHSGATCLLTRDGQIARGHYRVALKASRNARSVASRFFIQMT